MLYCTILCSTVLNYALLYYTMLYCTKLCSTVLNYALLYYTMLYCTILYSTVLYSTVLYSTVLYYTVLYYTVLYSTVLYSTVLYSTVLYSTVLYYTVLYSTVLYSTVVLYCTDSLHHFKTLLSTTIHMSISFLKFDSLLMLSLDSTYVFKNYLFAFLYYVVFIIWNLLIFYFV